MVGTIPYALKNFDRDVLADSHSIPVLVDYWASWCEPCRYLEPIIEKLASEANGKWKLVKVDTETHSNLTAEWGIRGIPNLKLFFKGQVIAELAGAMNETEMRIWIREKLPSKAKVLAMEASELLSLGYRKEGIKLLEQAIEKDSGLNEARLQLARLIVWENPQKVEPLVESIKHVEEAEELLLLSNLLIMNTDDLRDGKSKQEVIEAKESLMSMNFEHALQMLIKAIGMNKRYHNGMARKLVTAIFHILGERNELTKKYRRLLDMILY